MESKERFTGLGEMYQKYRSGYPEGYLKDLMQLCGLSPGSAAADVGAGTGLLTHGLLAQGLAVTAVEPNQEMRGELSSWLGKEPFLRILDGTAEKTGLAEQSVRLVTAGQAFHWFDQGAFRQECRRILVPDGWVSLVWNSRDEEDPAVQELKEVFRRFCPGFYGFSNGFCADRQVFAGFFREGVYESRCYANDLPYTRESFIGRSLSSSYAPREGDPGRPALIEALSGLFGRYAENGVLLLKNRTQSYTGRV